MVLEQETGNAIFFFYKFHFKMQKKNQMNGIIKKN